jgi:hypothetical protein
LGVFAAFGRDLKIGNMTQKLRKNPTQKGSKNTKKREIDSFSLFAQILRKKATQKWSKSRLFAASQNLPKIA